MYWKTILFLLIDATLAVDNPLCFRKNLIERRDEKLQLDINIEAAKISALSSEKLININFLQARKYYLLIKEDW